MIERRGGLWIYRVEEVGFEAGLEQGEGLRLTEVLGEGVPELRGCHREGSVPKAPEFGLGDGKQTG